MSNIWIFAGTTEGRKLAELALAQEGAGNRFFVSVATEYGKQLIPEYEDKITVFSGRLSEEEIKQKIKKYGIAMAVDATHPYAVEVSRNVKNACTACDISYIRLLREESRNNTADCITVPDATAAAEFLNHTEGNVLLTTGSKELGMFTKIQDYRKRLYPRILSTAEMVEKAISLGFDPSHLICMQGPFSFEMNRAMLLHTDASYLVTKESGRAGGFDEKLRAAEDTGVKVILIQRPEKEEGVSFVQACGLCGLQPEACRSSGGSRFPLFIEMEGKQVLVAGAGEIASRRIQVLSRFGCRLTVIAPEASSIVTQMEEEGKLELYRRTVKSDDIDGMDIVLAATDCRDVNRELGEACRETEILFNTADCREECDFYFPGIIQNGPLIAGVTAGGTNHRLAAKARRKIEQALKELRES